METGGTTQGCSASSGRKPIWEGGWLPDSGRARADLSEREYFFSLGKGKFAFFTLNFTGTRGGPPDESFPSPCWEKFQQCLQVRH